MTIHNPEGRDFGDGCKLGAYTYGTVNTSFCGHKDDDTHTCGAFEVGRYCSIANGVTFLCGGEHHTNWVTTYPFNILLKEENDNGENNEYLRTNKTTGRPGDIIVGNDVWLGRDVIVLNGVTIGDGCIIGAGAVVARDCEPFGVYIGNPARLTRYRFSIVDIERLLETRWWDMSMEEVRPYLPLLQSNKIQEFLEAMEKR